MIWSGSEPLSVLRLLALLSATQGGVPKKHWEPLRHEFVSAYGHQHLLTLHSLEQAGAARGEGLRERAPPRLPGAPLRRPGRPL